MVWVLELVSGLCIRTVWVLELSSPHHPPWSRGGRPQSPTSIRWVPAIGEAPAPDRRRRQRGTPRERAGLFFLGQLRLNFGTVNVTYQLIGLFQKGV